MNALSPLILKRGAFKTFAHDVDTGLGHAYLFLSEDGLVREEFLKSAAKRTFCKNICESCKSCREIEENSRLDVFFLDGANMKVKQITELTESAAVKPVSGDRKLYLIDNADKLNIQSQNKLLKTYEEPPSFVTVILAAASENGILPTIRSRAKKLYFQSLMTKEITALFISDGAEQSQAEIAAALGGGSLERAETFLNNENYEKLYNGCFEMLLNLNSSSQIVDYLYGELFTKENILISLDFLEIIIADIMKLTACEDASSDLLKNSGRLYDLKEIAKKFSAQSAAMALFAVNEARKKLKNNVSAVSSAETMLFDVLEARYKW